MEQIYLHLLAPAQVEIGARWHARRLSVADGRLATEITLAQMERVRGRLLPPPPAPAGQVFVACVEGEGHGIAARMLADFLLIDGWSVDYFERVGWRVQELRSGKGWTQQQLAEGAGLDRTYISGLEHGKQNPTLGALLRVARALEVPLDRVILGGTTPAQPPAMRIPT